MNTKQTEALRLALEFIERTSTYLPITFDDEGLAIHAAIREVLVANENTSAERVDETEEQRHEQPAQQEPLTDEQPAQQEPVGKWMGDCVEWTENPYKFRKGQPLYTSPPASKPWVPLTEFDIDQIPYSCSHADSRLIAFAIEAKLREKNA